MQSLFFFLTFPHTITITFPSDSELTSISDSAFSGCSSLAGIEIPESVESIGSRAFQDCSALKSISLPENVTSIGESAFFGCSSLISIDIPDQVEIIDFSTFENCSSLTEVDLPEALTLIRYYAFSGCSSLIIIEIPKTVTEIGGVAFADCSKLHTVTLPSDGRLSTIGYGAFERCSSLRSIDIPKTVTNMVGSEFLGCSALENIEVAAENSVFSSENGVWFDKNKEELIFYPAGKPASSYVIPGTVTDIQSNAFQDNTALTSITIPASVEAVFGFAFVDCTNLSALYFEGNYPSRSSAGLDSLPDNITIYYPHGATGWSSVSGAVPYYLPSDPPQGGSAAEPLVPTTEETLAGFLDTTRQNTPEGDTVELRVNLKSKTEGDNFGIEGQIIGDEFWDYVAGTDTKLTLQAGSATWEIDCKDIPTDAEIGDINFGVEIGSGFVPADALAKVPSDSIPLEIRLSHDGAFGFPLRLIIPFDESENGKYANLFYYNDTVTPPVVEYRQSVVIAGGEAVFLLSHASDYFAIVSKEAMDAGDIIGGAPAVSSDVTEIFTDIHAGDWYVAAVQYAYDNQLMNGTTATSFEPNAHASRAMIWTIAARMVGLPTEGGAFWYSNAQAAGVAAGITDGTNPEGNITREELVTMLYRMVAPEAVTAETLLGQYTDGDLVSDWAVPAMEWALAEGIISGKTATMLDPAGNATRAEIATILWRMDSR